MTDSKRIDEEQRADTALVEEQDNRRVLGTAVVTLTIDDRATSGMPEYPLHTTLSPMMSRVVAALLEEQWISDGRPSGSNVIAVELPREEAAGEELAKEIETILSAYMEDGLPVRFGDHDLAALIVSTLILCDKAKKHRLDTSAAR